MSPSALVFSMLSVAGVALVSAMQHKSPYGAKGPFFHSDSHGLLYRDVRKEDPVIQGIDPDAPKPWKALAQPEGQRKSLCTDGKLLPELYLLGAPKSSSTSLAFDLMNAGMLAVHDPFNDKEFHFFDGMLSWDWRSQEEIELQRQQWLHWMPNCPQDEDGLPATSRKLLADFTPDYMRLVSLPENSMRWGIFPPWNGNSMTQYSLGAMPQGGTWKVNMPPVLRKFYGDENSHRLTMIALIREPLARMQSAWYHAQSFNFTNECVNCRSPSFKSSLEEHVAKARRSPPVYSDWLWTGMYGAQLEQWLEHFSANRLLVIPYAYLMKGDKDAVCRELSTRLEFAIDCESNGIPISHEWSHPHPALEEDVSPEERAPFDEFMVDERARLLRVLADASKAGAYLANFDGDNNNEESIKNWLEAGW